ncbi:MAG: anti-sigma factor family protein [Bryobacteraceae bacterium]
MHQPIKEGFEEYLAGSEEPGGLRDFHAHLAECGECREMVGAMKQQASLLRELRSPAAEEPRPGFYARVMARIESQARPSFWAAFIEPAFARRLVYSSAVLLVLLGTYLFSSDPQEVVITHGPEFIMAEEDYPAIPVYSQEDSRDVILVNLATYRE